jgi:hypothetical protein
MANSIVFTSNSIISTYDTPGIYTWIKGAYTTEVTVIAGGGGGGADSGTERAGGAGASIRDYLDAVAILASGAGGLESVAIDGEDGLDQVSTGGICTGGTGAGGGGGQSVGGVAGIGGKGGFPGGGGGGGGGSLNGTNSGAGGNGGDGLVIVIENF